MKKIVLITILLLLHFITTAIPASPETKVELSFKEKIPAWLTEYDVPAVGIGVIENGKVKYVKVFGTLQKNIPAPDNAIFNIYPESIYKFFVKEFHTAIEFVEDRNGAIEKMIIYSRGRRYAEALKIK